MAIGPKGDRIDFSVDVQRNGTASVNEDIGKVTFIKKGDSCIYYRGMGRMYFKDVRVVGENEFYMQGAGEVIEVSVGDWSQLIFAYYDGELKFEYSNDCAVATNIGTDDALEYYIQACKAGSITVTVTDGAGRKVEINAVVTED